MTRRLIALLLALSIASTPAPLFAQSMGGGGVSNPGSSVTPPCSAFGTTAGTCVQGNDSRITGAAPASTTVRKLGQSTLPFVLLSSGTMGNNGALSGITAVPTAYPNAYCSVPAGAIATGIPAAQTWYYCTFSDTTHATLFNNTYTSGTPTIPASPTAFVTTGPGAFTQTVGSNIASYTLAIAGNTIGLNGTVRVMGARTINNSAGAKTVTLNYGSFTIATAALTATTGAPIISGFSNRGATNVQVGLLNNLFSVGNAPPNYGAIDSTTAQNLTFNLQLATATDTITLESAEVELAPGVP